MSLKHYLKIMAKTTNSAKNNTSQKPKELNAHIKSLLIKRGLKTEEEMMSLFDDKILTDPFKLTNMKKICERIKVAIENKEKIIICGDYDADGTVSTAMLVRFFREMKYPVSWYIPHRIEEGYGISAIGVENLVKNEQAQLLISVDNGIAAFDAGDKSIELGVDLIVTDHHDVVDNKLPNCYAILNPKIEQDNESYRYLAGAGVALYLIRAMKRFFKLDYINLDKYLLLCTLASIADVVPLREENRTLVKKGLALIKSKHNEISGLTALLEEAKIDLRYIHNLSAQDVGFKIAPMLNAAGRLEGAEKTIHLLIEEKYKDSKPYAEALKSLNMQRRAESDLLLEKVKNNLNFEQNVLISSGDDYHAGIIGVVAGKIKELTKKPTIIISFNPETKIGKASCRSIEGFNIVKALENSRELFEGFGGHYMAAGFSIKKENLNKFVGQINQYFKDNFDPKNIKDDYDLEMINKDFTPEFLEQMNQLEPFGAKLELPKILYTGKIEEISVIKDAHLIIKFQNNIDAWLFFDVTQLEYIQSQIYLKIIAELSVKNKKISLTIKKIVR